MNGITATALVLIAALAGGVAAAAGLSAQSADNTLSEQVESGQMTRPGAPAIHYRIRLLPPESFPKLPASLLQKLDAMQCLIPQTFEAHGPENVIHGSFERKGSDDWALLCSQHGNTTLYVFFGDRADAPSALRSQPDTEWLGVSYGSTVYGSAWGISVRHPESMHASRKEGPVDHDGIEDAQIEKSSIVHYDRDGTWTTVRDQN